MLLYIVIIDFLDSGGPVVRTARQQFLQFYCSCEDCGLVGAVGAANTGGRALLLIAAREQDCRSASWARRGRDGTPARTSTPLTQVS